MAEQIKVIGKVLSDIVEWDGQICKTIGFPNGDKCSIPLHLFLPFTDGTCEVSPKWEHYDHYLSICMIYKDYLGTYTPAKKIY